MKKLLLFGAALFAAFSVSAEVISFAGVTAADITTDGTIGTYTMGEAEVPSVSQPDGVDINVKLAGRPNLVINYTQSAGKTKDNILKFAAEYMQADGKNVILTFSNVKVGSVIELTVKAKGSTASVFEAFEGAVADASNPASVDNTDFAVVKFTAVASTVKIKETAGGYRISQAVAEFGSSALFNVEADAQKAVKFMHNGQLYIQRGNKVYNALGTVVEIAE